MGNVYVDTSGITRINFMGAVDDHLPAVTFDNEDSVVDQGDYTSFGSSILSENKIIEKGTKLSSAVSISLAEKANQLGLRGQEYSDYVELNIIPAIKTKKDSAVSALVAPVEDKTFEKPFSQNTGANLIDVLKQTNNEQSEIASETLNAINHMTTLMQNQNEILKQANEIAIEKNRIHEVELHSKDAFNQSLIEGVMSMGQSLGYLPTLIETIAISSDRNAELQNVANSHHFQKNVNDSYEFNHNKDDEQGSTQSLKNISNHLASSATSHASIVQPIKNQGDLAKVKKIDHDEENSLEFLDFLSSAVDGLTEQIADVDIFTYLLDETRIKKEDLRNGNY